MLLKENRLKNKKDFEYLFRKGLRFKEDFLELRVLRNKLKDSRFGFVVGKVVSKKATIRNKIKRRMRDIVRKKIYDIKNGLDCVVISRPTLSNKNFLEIEKTINSIFNKAGILKK